MNIRVKSGGPCFNAVAIGIPRYDGESLSGVGKGLVRNARRRCFGSGGCNSEGFNRILYHSRPRLSISPRKRPGRQAILLGPPYLFPPLRWEEKTKRKEQSKRYILCRHSTPSSPPTRAQTPFRPPSHPLLRCQDLRKRRLRSQGGHSAPLPLWWWMLHPQRVITNRHSADLLRRFPSIIHVSRKECI